MKRYLSGFPSKAFSAEIKNIPWIIKKSIIGNLAPEKPLIGKDAKVWSIGSCFADEIARMFHERKIPAYNMHLEDQWISAFALKLVLSWIIHDTPLGEETLTGRDKRWGAREKLKSIVERADILIVTLGVSLCWFDLQGRLVIDPAASKLNSDERISRAGEAHVMRQTTVDENTAEITACIDLIRSVRPNLPIILTLSPVPMVASIADMPIIPSSVVSKAILRAALENIRIKNLPNVYYWPSYEIVTWYGAHIERAYGDEDRDARHVRQHVIDLIGDAFIEAYFDQSE